MSLRTGTAAVEWAAGQSANPSQDWYQYCLKFTRKCFNVASMYADAAQAWGEARYKHGSAGTPPLGTPVWWTGGSSGHGHVVISAGTGYCWSTDIKRRGKVDKVPISYITRNWGLRYRGWTEDINAVRVYRPATATRPAVDLSNVIDAFRRDYTGPQGEGLHEADVYRVERALEHEGLLARQYASNGYAGTAARSAYAKWQQRSGVGGPYDGIPGIKSLTLLGDKYAFRVVA